MSLRVWIAALIFLQLFFTAPTPVLAAPPQEVEVARTENSKRFLQSDGQVRVEVHLSAIHYKDNYDDPEEPWKDIDTTIVNGRVDKAPFTLVIDEKNLSATMTDKKTGEVTTVSLDSLYPGKASFNPATVAINKSRSNNSVKWTEIAPGVDFEIVVEPTKVRFSRVIKSPSAFQDAEFSITGPNIYHRAMDAQGMPVEVETSKLGYFVRESFSASPGQYPIRIDPSYEVGDSNNDAGGRVTSAYFDTAWTVNPAGAMTSTYRYYAGMIYESVEVPNAAVITSAYINFTCGIEASAGANAYAQISAYDVDSAPTAFTTAGDYVTWLAANTTAITDWDNIPAWVIDSVYQSPSIVDVIQEIVDRPGWSSGNNIMIFFEDYSNRSPHVDGNRRYAYTYDSDSSKTPVLFFTFAGAPSLTTTYDSSGSTTVTVTGTIVDTGDDHIDIRGFQIGVSTGVYTSNWTETGTFSVGDYSHTFTGLNISYPYYIRSMAVNSDTAVGYGNEIFGPTKPAPPTGLTLNQTGWDSVNITWTKGAGADNTTVQGEADSYPSSTTDGFSLYNGTGTNTSASGMQLNTASYFFRSWSYNVTSGFSEEYAQANLGGQGMNNLTLFLVFPALMGMPLLLAAVLVKRKNLLLSLGAALFWLFIGLWWVIEDVFSGFNLTGEYVDLIQYVPFIFFFLILIEYMIRANQTEIQRTLGGRQWSEFGTPPKEYKSGYEAYKERLFAKTRKGGR